MLNLLILVELFRDLSDLFVHIVNVITNSFKARCKMAHWRTTILCTSGCISHTHTPHSHISARVEAFDNYEIR